MIDLCDRQRSYRLDRARLVELARAVLSAEGVRLASVELAVVGDDEMARLNARYLGHRGPTDVLSFDLTDTAGREGPPRRPADVGTVAQVVVSVDTARRQARQRGHSILAELALYVTHGLLHLLGYDDQSEPDRRRMHARQIELLKQAGFALKG